MANRSLDKITVKDLIKNKGKLVLAPAYQRAEVWSKKDQQKLIDSIHINIGVGMLTVRTNKDLWEIIDGQQRIVAILAYVMNKFEDLDGHKYTDLTTAKKNKFDSYELFIENYLDSTNDFACKVFRRNNSGRPLRKAEIRNSILGKMRDCIYKKAREDDFILNHIDIKNNRFAKDELIARLICYEINGSMLDTLLDEMYEEYSINICQSSIKDFEATIKAVKQMSNGKSLRYKTDIIHLYLIAKHLILKGAISTSIFEKLGQWYFDTEKTRNNKESYRSLSSKYSKKSLDDRFEYYFLPEVNRLIAQVIK